MPAPIKPRSAACLISSRASFQSLFSSSSMRGTTSASTNCRVVSAIIRCSSLKSSGVKTSSAVRSSIRKLPPLKISFCSSTAAMTISFQAMECGDLSPLSTPQIQSGDKSPHSKIQSQSLKYSRGAHAAADAHRHHAVTALAAFQLAQNRSGQLRSGATERMPQSDRASIHVYFVRVEPERPDYRQRLRGESFVQFNHIDLIESQPGQLQGLRNRKDRPDAHLFRRTTGGGVRNQARQRLCA